MEDWIVKRKSWKQKVRDYNNTKLKKFEYYLNETIPWLVLILLAIVIGEFAGEINTLISWTGLSKLGFLANFGDWIHHHHTAVIITDYFIILGFMGELYFKYFRAISAKSFVKSHFLDIIAVIPVGLIIGTIQATTSAQQTLHAIFHSQKAVKTTAHTAKIVKVVARTPRFIRILRLKKLFKKK